MSDFLGYLIARSYDRAEVVQPRPVSLFEPSPENGGVSPSSLPEENMETLAPDTPTHPPAVVATPQPSPSPSLSQRDPKPSKRDDADTSRQAPPQPQIRHVVEQRDAPVMPLAPPDPPQPLAPPAIATPPDIPVQEQAKEQDMPPPPVASLRPSAPAQAPVRPDPAPTQVSSQLIPPPSPLPPSAPKRTVEMEPLTPRRTRPVVDQPEEPQAPRRPLFEPTVQKTVLEPATQPIVIERIVETVTQPGAAQPQISARRDDRNDRARYEPLMPPPEPEGLSQDLAARPSALPEVRDRSLAEPPMAPEAPPTIQVTIGRVEVRATPAPARKKKKARPQPTVMSLDDYLKQRAQGGSR